MSLIDLILNLAGLLLWVSWRSIPFDPFTRRTPTTLAGTLRRAAPTRFQLWYFLAALVGLLLVRGFFYWWVGGKLDWMPTLKLGAVAVAFRSDYFWRMLLFSCASFFHALVIYYLWMILLSMATSRSVEADACQRFVKVQLGFVHSRRAAFKAILPLAGAVVVWLAVGPLLSALGIVPPVKSFLHRVEQGVVLGMGTYLVWQYAIGAVLALYLVNSYIYLGSHPLWNFIQVTARWLLAPLRRLPLRIGKVDFAPVAGIALVFVAAEMIQRGLPLLFARLPL